MRHLLFSLAIFVVSATQAMALSCLPVDVPASFKRAQEDSAQWIIVKGRLTFDESKLPETDWDRQELTPQKTRIPARFRGKSLTRAGFTNTFKTPLTLEVQCAGPWCAGAASGEYLAFVRKDAGGYTAIAAPCGGWLFANPTPTQLGQAQQCLTGGPCEPEGF